jgi:hypothetical protein
VGLLSDYLLGFTDVIRGAFSRDDERKNLGYEIAVTSGPKKPKWTVQMLKGTKRAQMTTSRSMQGLTRIASATIKAPKDITLSTVQGLHNAPKIYGDRTVREMPKATGLGSGLKAAGKVRKLFDQASSCTYPMQELALGVYDGFSGVVTQPIKGRIEGGTAGMYKGIGRGIGGILLKPFAGKLQCFRPYHELMRIGVAGVLGLTFKAIYEETQKTHGKTVDGRIRASLILQGYNEVKDLKADERTAIVEQWKTMEANNRKAKKRT